MERTIPLLNQIQIEELNSMINSISIENGKSLEDLLSKQVEVENSTVMRRYLEMQSSTNWSLRNGTRNRKPSTTSVTLQVPPPLSSHHDVYSLISLGPKGRQGRASQPGRDRYRQPQQGNSRARRISYAMQEENDIFKHKISETEFHLDRVSDEKEKFE